MKPSFAEGIIVQHKDWVGEVRFVCDEYISVCVRVGNNRVNDVCVLVHRNDWNQVKLLKESGK
jgi:hypothetical protein